ncbi:conserved hypothetical protein [Ricinus communis]|uniref:Uncharacterized protein n=1 Tax=Ricinus communis TaxID=3988 RepID=B9T913_RICCO|nr:conserved hypothetical protein [Ricinus communis]EEF27652.1 conserved hypothetical protein [Ricinus communis]
MERDRDRGNNDRQRKPSNPRNHVYDLRSSRETDNPTILLVMNNLIDQTTNLKALMVVA